MSRRGKTHEEYEQELFEKEIDYFPVEKYIKYKTPILHECLQGHQWKTSPSNIFQGHGCPSCYGNKNHNTNSYKQELLLRGIIKYTPVEEYVNAATPIYHLCNQCQNIWKVNTYSILRGSGCPRCAKYGFDPSNKALLYFVSFMFEDITYYKIGVTNHSPEQRFKQYWNKYSMRTIWGIPYETGAEALLMEKALLKQYATFKFNTKAFYAGNTETITIEIPKPKKYLDIE